MSLRGHFKSYPGTRKRSVQNGNYSCNPAVQIGLLPTRLFEQHLNFAAGPCFTAEHQCNHRRTDALSSGIKHLKCSTIAFEIHPVERILQVSTFVTLYSATLLTELQHAKQLKLPG